MQFVRDNWEKHINLVCRNNIPLKLCSTSMLQWINVEWREKSKQKHVVVARIATEGIMEVWVLTDFCDTS
jgi:hypothetical protein